MNRIANLEKEINSALETFIADSSLLWRVEVYDEVSSTMEIARSLSSINLSESGIYLALKQKSGRGRLGRKWESPAGGLYVTYLFPTQAELGTLAGCSLVVGCAISKALGEVGCRSRLKWPNDVLSLSGKKIAGILIEVVNIGSITAILCGVGLNLSERPQIVENATSLRELGIEDLLIPKMAARIATHTKDYLSRFFVSGFSAFRSEWMRNAASIGQHIVVTNGAKQIKGMFLDVTAQGAMRIESEGKIEMIHSGDVENL